jgi:hypothetical protein
MSREDPHLGVDLRFTLLQPCLGSIGHLMCDQKGEDLAEQRGGIAARSRPEPYSPLA